VRTKCCDTAICHQRGPDYDVAGMPDEILGLFTRLFQSAPTSVGDEPCTGGAARIDAGARLREMWR
jgi:hypothetical protein